jgi:hypothetical protein
MRVIKLYQFWILIPEFRIAFLFFVCLLIFYHASIFLYIAFFWEIPLGVSNILDDARVVFHIICWKIYVLCTYKMMCWSDLYLFFFIHIILLIPREVKIYNIFGKRSIRTVINNLQNTNKPTLMPGRKNNCWANLFFSWWFNFKIIHNNKLETIVSKKPKLIWYVNNV